MIGRSERIGAFAQNKRLGRGVNIVGYDPVWKPRGEARMREEHFRLIVEAGFQSVRIPLHPWRDLPPGVKGVVAPTWLGALDWVVQQALDNRLVAILDFHEYQAMGADPAGNHERYLETWRILASHCRDLPGDILFELLNEPNRELTPPLWNEYLQEAHAIVRETNPDRTLVIGPGNFNSIDHLKELVLPEDDRNIIVTIHYYKPGEFTHQGASWSSYRNMSGIAWNGTAEEVLTIQSDLETANAWAIDHDRPLYLGEFSVYDAAPMDSRTRWLHCVARQAEELGWSWGYWQFDSDFVLYDIDSDQWITPVLDALIPSQR